MRWETRKFEWDLGTRCVNVCSLCTAKNTGVGVWVGFERGENAARLLPALRCSGRRPKVPLVPFLHPVPIYCASSVAITLSTFL